MIRAYCIIIRQKIQGDGGDFGGGGEAAERGADGGEGGPQGRAPQAPVGGTAAKPAAGGLPCGPQAGCSRLRKRGKLTGRLQGAGQQQGAGRAAGPAAAAAAAGEAHRPRRSRGGLRPPVPRATDRKKTPAEHPAKQGEPSGRGKAT